MAGKSRVAARGAGRLLASLNVTGTSVRFEPFETVFAQGDRCAGVMYLEKGRVRLSVVSPGATAAVVAVVAAGSFFGEGALAGQHHRTSTAETLTRSTITIVSTRQMRRQLHDHVAVSDRFRSHMLAKNARLEADLVSQLFVDRSEPRLARALLVLAHFDEHQLPRHELPQISRNLLAEMSGTTRSRVDTLMNKFRKLGFLERNDGVQIHRSMLSVVLQE